MIFKLFNIFFRIFLIFLICLVWIRYFVDDLGLALTYTAIITISIEFLLHFILSRRKEKNSIKHEEELLAEKISATFIFSPKAALDYFYNLAKINYSAKKYSKFVILTPKISKNLKNEKLEDLNIQSEQAQNEIKQEKLNNLDEMKKDRSKTILYPMYSYSPITAQTLVDIVNNVGKHNPTKLIVCGYKIDMDAYKLAQKLKDFKVILLNSNDCYIKLIKFHNFYPENLKDLSLQNKLKFKELLRLSVSKKRSKGYFIASLFLLFSSFIVRLNIYYVVMSSTLLLLSLISFFLPQRTKLESQIL
jgi:hypothetical protein